MPFRNNHFTMRHPVVQDSYSCQRRGEEGTEVIFNICLKILAINSHFLKRDFSIPSEKCMRGFIHTWKSSHSTFGSKML